MNNKRKEGFTLVELLAVIAIISILVVMALPAVLKMVNQAKRALFRQTAYSYIGAAKDKCMSENIKGESDTFTYMSEDGVIDTGGEFKKYITGTEPDKVQLSTTPKCSSTIAIYDKNMKLCAFKDYDMEEVLLANVSDSSKCEIGKEIKDDSAPIFTGYSCSNPGDIKITEEKYFTFDQKTGTITGYSDEGPKDIIIPCQIGGKNVTAIGISAFYSKSLTSVIMPDTIKKIDRYAFYNNKISKLELGNSVETIDYGAFKSNQLTELVLPNSLKTIIGYYSNGYQGAFYSNKLTEVTFGSGIEYIGPNSFVGSSSGNQITKVDFSRSNNLETIEFNAFSGNKILNLDITNSNALITIGSNSFKGNQLTSLKLKGKNLTIYSGAFENNLIEELELKGTVTSVVADALKNNQMPDEGAYIYGSYNDNKPTSTTLTSYAGANRNNILIPDEITTVTATFSDLGLSGTFDSGDGLTIIKDSMFSSNALTKVIIGNSVTSIGGKAFYNNKIESVIIGNSVKTVKYYAFANNKLTKLELGNSVEIINYGAFKSNKLTELVLPNSLKTIEGSYSNGYQGAFYSNKLTKVTFGSGIEYIGTNAFLGNSSGNQITKVDFSRSNNLKTIESNAFSGNKILNLNITNSNALTTIGSNSFKGNQLTSLKLKGKNLTIYSGAFENNLIEELELKGTVTSVVADALKNNQMPDEGAYIYGSYNDNKPTSTTLTSYAGANRNNITIPDEITTVTATFSGLGISGTFDSGDGLTIIKDSMFSSNALTKVIIGNSVTSIGREAFYNNKISKLELGNSVETINYGAFESNQLTELVLPNSLKTIEGFSSNKLTKVTFGSGIEKIGKYAFLGNSSGNQITKVDFSRSNNLKTIESNAFSGNKLTSLKFNGSNLTIGSGAFSGNLIEELEFKGTITSVGVDAFKNNQMPDEGAYIYGSYSDGKPTSTTLTSYAGANRNNIIIPDEITTITATFSGLGISGTFDSGDGLTIIKDSMFSSNALTKVIIGNSVTSIGREAFYNNKISKLELGNSVETINYGAFKNNQLTELVLPNSLKTIEGYYSNGYQGAFSSNKLTKVTFGSGIEKIGKYAFLGNSSGNQITKVDFSRSNNLKTIESNAFSGNKLTDIEIPSSVTTIGSSAFYNNSITDLEIPTSVKTIGASAFSVNKLTDIEIPSSVTTIGSSAFASNANLSRIFIYGKVDSSNFTSLGSSWNGTCTNIIYELDSCYGLSGNTITSYAKSCSKKIEIPTELGGNKITAIGDNAFKDAGLTNVIIPESITSIGANAFSGNTIDPIIVKGKASSKDFTSLGTNWNNSNHVIYEKDLRTCLKGTSTTVTGFYSNSICTSAVIPNTVTTIEANAFKGILLDKITVEDGTRLTNLGNNWNGTVYKIDFEGDSYDYNCFTLDGSKVTKYKNYCKANVDLSTSIQGKTITEIGDNAFNNTSITSAVLGSKITKIGINSFSNNNLSSVTLNNGLIEIGDKAFYNTGLTTVVIPRTVTTIGNNVFDSNTGLESITINGKSNSSEFDKLGTNWNGTCTNIIYSK